MEEGGYEAPEIVPGSPEDIAEKVKELEALLTGFEEKHDLNELHAVTVRNYDELEASVIRLRARGDLDFVHAVVKYLGDHKAPPELYKLAMSRYYAIQRAMGTYEGVRAAGVLNHDRPAK